MDNIIYNKAYNGNNTNHYNNNNRIEKEIDIDIIKESIKIDNNDYNKENRYMDNLSTIILTILTVILSSGLLCNILAFGL